MIEKSLQEKDLRTLFPILDDYIHQGIKIILLQGDLASGKTTLVQKYIAYKNPNFQATSPTFNFMQQYGNFYHYDLYHHSLENFIYFGFLEYLDNDGIHFIEWGEGDLATILKNSGYNYLTLKIIKETTHRIYRIIYE